MRGVPIRDLFRRVPRTTWLFPGLVVALVAGTVAVVQLNPSAVAAESGGPTEAVSVDTSSKLRDGFSSGPAISADGRFVAFTSNAQLVPTVTNTRVSNIYVRDTTAHTTTLISHGPVGPAGPVSANNNSRGATTSADSRYIAFSTRATDLPGIGRHHNEHVVLCDQGSGAGGGAAKPCVFTDLAWPASPADTGTDPHLSADGSRVALLSGGRAGIVNLSRLADGTVNVPDANAFVHPAVPQTISQGGKTWAYELDQQVALSTDGRWLARVSQYSIGDVDSSFTYTYVVWLTDLSSADTIDQPQRLDLDAKGATVAPTTASIGDIAISGNGNRVAFQVVPNDSTFAPVVYAVNRAGGKPAAVVASLDNAGKAVAAGSPSLSGDGRYLAFSTDAAGAHNGVDDATRQYSCLHPEPPQIKAYVTGGTAVRDPLPAATQVSWCDVVVRDLTVDEQRAAAKPALPRLPGELASASVTTTCKGAVAGKSCEGTGESVGAVLDADGSAVAFASDADDLIAGDNNESGDVFVHRFQPTLTIDPVDFGKVAQGNAKTGEAQVHHSGFGPLTVQSTTIGGTNATDFTVFPGQTCLGTVLHETDSCFVSIRFKPTDTGTRAAALTATPLRAGPPATGNLSGIGEQRQPPRTPQFSASPNPLAFGAQQPFKDSPVKTVTVTNPGTYPLVISAVALIGSAPTGFPSDYRIASNTCVGTPVMPGGASCQVGVVFAPQAVTDRPALLQFTDNVVPGTQVVALTGGGAAPTLTAAPPLAPAGQVSQLTGTGFPPNKQILLVLDGMPGQTTVTSDANGGFQAPLVILPHTSLGKRQVHATVQGVPNPVAAATDFLVVPGTLQPPDFAQRH